MIAAVADLVTSVPVSQLTPAPWNPRLIKDARFKQLCRSLEADPDFLWQRPILAMADGTVYAGNMRLRAAQHLKWASVPAIVADVPEQLAKERALRDNNGYGAWQEDDLAALVYELEQAGSDLDLLGFEDDFLQQLREISGAGGETAEDPGAQIDRADELREKWQTERGQLWVIGRHRLLCGDSTSAEDVARLMGGEKAALCFTSPPYDQQRDYGGCIGDWQSLMRGVFGQLVMKPDGQVLVNLGLIHRDGETIPYWDAWLVWMRENGWRRFGWYVWDQGDGLPGDWNGRLAPSFEFVFHFNQRERDPNKIIPCKHAGETNHGHGLRAKDGSVGAYSHAGRSVQNFKVPDSVIRTTREKRSTQIQALHPAPYPVEFPSLLIESYSNDGESVYDPFLGSGTTMVAAEQLGRICYGMEIEPKYVAVALQRLADMGLEPRLTGLTE